MADKPLMEKSFNEDLDVDLKLREGGVHAKIYLEVQGLDFEAAKQALQNTVYNKLASESNVHMLNAKTYDILKEKGDYFSGVSEIEVVADDFRYFVSAILRYGPSAIEIIEPNELKLDMEQMHSMVADVSDFVHMYSQQIISMFKDPERRKLYEKMLKE